MKHIIAFLGVYFLIFTVNAQSIEWVNFNELEAKMKVQPKKVLVFIHTSWCKYCLIQENKTFTDSATIALLQKDYYCLKLNAEQTDSIVFLGKTYHGNAQQNHELAATLGTKNGQLLFPTTVFFTNQLQLENIWQGLLKPGNVIAN